MTSEDDAQRFSYICTYYLLPGVDSNTPVGLTGPFFFSQLIRNGRRGTKGVRYHYCRPLFAYETTGESSTTFEWKTSDWSPCSVSCSTGKWGLIRVHHAGNAKKCFNRYFDLIKIILIHADQWLKLAPTFSVLPKSHCVVFSFPFQVDLYSIAFKFMSVYLEFLSIYSLLRSSHRKRSPFHRVLLSSYFVSIHMNL